MYVFETTIKQITKAGDKKGWTYIEIPEDISQKLYPKFRQSFQIKGKLDSFSIKMKTIFPMSGGGYFMSLNAAFRKGIGKKTGATIKVQLERDKTIYKIDADFIACLSDEPDAKSFFERLSKSHQNYFSKWIETAKTTSTKTKRIVLAVNSLSKKMNFPKMLRSRNNNID